MKAVYEVAPAVVLWYIWKSRNTIIHEGSYSYNRVVYDATRTLYLFANLKFPRIVIIPVIGQYYSILDTTFTRLV